MKLEATSELLSALSDPTRVRLLALLQEENELSVAELTSITALSQSRVSTHLGKLKRLGFIQDRRDGRTTFYRLNKSDKDAPTHRLWQVIEPTLDDPQLQEDAQRRDAIVAARSARAWPDSVAGAMERHYSPGRTWEATARGLIPLLKLGSVLDIGCGDGVSAELLVHHCEKYTGIDRSARMIQAARDRVRGHEKVEFIEGDMHELPTEDNVFDQVLCLNVLTYANQPLQALQEINRVLKKDGKATIVTLEKHDHFDIASGYGHINVGFTPDELRELISKAGLEVESCGLSSRERQKPYFKIITALVRAPH